MKRANLWRRCTAALVVLCMSISLCVPVLAESGTVPEPEPHVYDVGRGSIRVDGTQVTQNGVIYEDDAPIITGESSSTTLTVLAYSGTTRVTLRNLHITNTNSGGGGAVKIEGGTNCTVELVLEGTNVLKSENGDGAGILHNRDTGAACLLVLDGTGSLEATGVGRGAGIGAATRGYAGGSVTINGGTITVVGGDKAAGIGGADGVSSSPILINDGHVTVVGGLNRAALGSGREYDRGYSNCCIYGGEVTLIRRGGNGRWIDGLETGALAGNVTLKTRTDSGDVEENSVSGQYYGLNIRRRYGTTPVTSNNVGTVLRGYTGSYNAANDTFTFTAGVDAQPFDQETGFQGSGSTSIELNNEVGALTQEKLSFSGMQDVSIHAGTAGDLMIDCTGNVELVNRQGSAVEGNLEICGGKVTITTQSEAAAVGGNCEIAAFGDVEITSGGPVAQGSFALTQANDVRLHSGGRNAMFGSTAKITASGAVELAGSEAGNSIPQGVVYRQAQGADYRVFWQQADGTSGTPQQSAGEEYTSAAEYCFVQIRPASDAGSVRVHGGFASAETAYPGSWVTVTAAAPAAGAVFEGWTVDAAPEDFTLEESMLQNESIRFQMPAGDVELTAHWSGIPDAAGDAAKVGGAIAAVVVGGAVVWGGYEAATRVILHKILPEGAAIPTQRGQLALLVWDTAGRPEPENAPAFADVTDAELAQAAQWCTEQGYLSVKEDGTFRPGGHVTKYRVIEVWSRAFPKQ